MEPSRYCPKCNRTFDPIGNSIWSLHRPEKITATCESKGFGDCNPDSDYKEQPKNQEPIKK